MEKHFLLLLLIAFTTTCFAQTDTAAQNKSAQVDLPAPPSPPKFPGGNEAILTFLDSHVKRPEGTPVHGKVVMKYTVGPDGNVADAHIIQGVEPALDAEIIRVFKMLPQFEPARSSQNGKPVKQDVIIMFDM